MEIEYWDYCIGMKIDEQIVLNPNLKKFPKLHDFILSHELEHSDGFTQKDIKHDLKHAFFIGNIKQLKMSFVAIGFSFVHPKALVQELSPIIFYKKSIVFQPILLMIYIFILIMVFIIHNLWRYAF